MPRKQPFNPSENLSLFSTVEEACANLRYQSELNQCIKFNLSRICQHKNLSTKTSSNNISNLDRYVPTYVRSYLTDSILTRTKTHQFTPNQIIHLLKFYFEVF